jgi:hypothetical protein
MRSGDFHEFRNAAKPLAMLQICRRFDPGIGRSKNHQLILERERQLSSL